MVKLTLLYSQPDDPSAFEAHYLGRHVELTRLIPGLLRLEVSRATPPTGDYYFVTELYFADLDSLQAALASPETVTAGEDTKNFADVTSISVISEVLVS